jgi:hypothetical protein
LMKMPKQWSKIRWRGLSCLQKERWKGPLKGSSKVLIALPAATYSRVTTDTIISLY